MTGLVRSEVLSLALCVRTGSGYKVSELAALGEGETLMVGGKEVEVMGLISAEDFARGRCFQEAHVEKEEEAPKSGPPLPRRSASKPFCSPLLGRAENASTRALEEQPCRPRHDPLATGSNQPGPAGPTHPHPGPTGPTHHHPGPAGPTHPHPGHGPQQRQACNNRVAGWEPFGKRSLEQGTFFPHYITSHTYWLGRKLHIFPQPTTCLFGEVKSFLPRSILLLVFQKR